MYFEQICLLPQKPNNFVKPWARSCLSDDDYFVLTKRHDRLPLLHGCWNICIAEEAKTIIRSCSASTSAVLVQVSESVAVISSTTGICLYITAKFNIFAREFSLLDLVASQTIFPPTCTHPECESAKQVNQTFISFWLVLDF